MNREELLELVAAMPVEELRSWADRVLTGELPLKIVGPPTVSLLMLKARDTVDGQPFYLGEMTVTVAQVELAGTRGYAMIMGRDERKALAAAILDAALVKGHVLMPELEIALRRHQGYRLAADRQEWQEVARTRVDFYEAGERRDW